MEMPFAKTVLVEFSKWYLETDRWLWWKRIFLQLKTENRLSEKLVCDMWIPLTELQLCFVELFSSLITVESENCYFGSLWRLKGQRKYPSLKLERSFLRNFFVICEFISQSYSFPLKKPFAKIILAQFEKWYLEANRRLWWKRNILR